MQTSEIFILSRFSIGCATHEDVEFSLPPWRDGAFTVYPGISCKDQHAVNESGTIFFLTNRAEPCSIYANNPLAISYVDNSHRTFVRSSLPFT